MKQVYTLLKQNGLTVEELEAILKRTLHIKSKKMGQDIFRILSLFIINLTVSSKYSDQQHHP